MKFGIPRIWRVPTDHSTNCYFCMVDPSKRRSGKNAPPIRYVDIPSSIAPVPHSAKLVVPNPPVHKWSTITSEACDDFEPNNDSDIADDIEIMTENDKMPYFPKQHDLNDLIRDLNLTKSCGELITSRLWQ